MFGADTTNQTQSSDGQGLTPQPTISSDTIQAPTLTTPSSTVTTTPPQTSDPVLSIDSVQTPNQSNIPQFNPSDVDGKTPVEENTDSDMQNNDLMKIKKEALEKLGPLVDKLDQKPEDKFKTIMMMIQASDDQSLVSKAYEVINNIEDENTKAQALLDLVNEINYFTNQASEK